MAVRLRTDGDWDALERRIARLEESLFFQDRLLSGLNDALTGQQHQLDSMEESLKELRERMEEMRLLLERGTGPANTPPPHYL